MEPVGPSDDLERRRERTNYRVLEYVYLRTGEDCEIVVEASEVTEELGISAEETTRAIEHLSNLGCLTRPGGASRVCITQRGIGYLQRSAWRRRSVRES